MLKMSGFSYKSLACNAISIFKSVLQAVIVSMGTGYTYGVSLPGGIADPQWNDTSQWDGNCAVVNGKICGFKTYLFCEEGTDMCVQCHGDSSCIETSNKYNEENCRKKCPQWWIINHPTTPPPPQPTNGTFDSVFTSNSTTDRFFSTLNDIARNRTSLNDTITHDASFAVDIISWYWVAILVTVILVISVILLVVCFVTSVLMRKKTQSCYKACSSEDPDVSSPHEEEYVPLNNIAIHGALVDPNLTSVPQQPSAEYGSSEKAIPTNYNPPPTLLDDAEPDTSCLPAASQQASEAPEDTALRTSSSARATGFQDQDARARGLQDQEQLPYPVEQS